MFIKMLFLSEICFFLKANEVGLRVKLVVLMNTLHTC